MKQYIYTSKDGDSIFGMLSMSAHKHFIAESIQSFYKKVGQWIPVTWFILGEYETTTGVLTPYEIPEVFDWEKQLCDDSLKDKGNSIETSSIAQAIEENGGNDE